jgi:hypothetical protein
MNGTKDLVWSSHRLRLGRHTVASLVPDADWPGMWRVRIGEALSDMVNLTRAKDAAAGLALSVLNTRESHREAPPMRSFSRAVSLGLST